MLTPIGTVILALVCIGLGIGIAEYYHYRIDRARRETVPLDQPDLWDLSHPTPQPLMNTQDFARMKRTGRITKMVGGGRG
jgi:hypothetical protein